MLFGLVVWLVLVVGGGGGGGGGGGALIAFPATSSSFPPFSPTSPYTALHL